MLLKNVFADFRIKPAVPSEISRSGCGSNPTCKMAVAKCQTQSFNHCSFHAKVEVFKCILVSVAFSSQILDILILMLHFILVKMQASRMFV